MYNIVMIKPRILLDKIKAYYNSPEAIIITGMRRTGKTTILRYVYDQMESQNKIFLDLENPLNRKYFEEENYERIKYVLETLGIDFSKQPFVFCDEIQFVKAMPSIVKYLIDHYRVKFFLTGSASFYLKNLFSESLAGRKYIFELYPLSFREFLIFKDSRLKVPADAGEVTQSVFDSFSNLYEEYILFGGFPEVVLKNNIDEKKKALEDIFTSFFQLEIMQLGDFRKNQVIRDLMLLLMQRIGSRMDVQKISSELGVSRATLNEYIDFLEGTYFIKTIKPFGRGKDIEIRKSPKFYVCDSGFANHFARLDTGAVFENAVFQNLLLLGKLNYYQRKSGVEVDFILNEKTAFEVKLSARISDIKRLKELSMELKLDEYKLISKNFNPLPDIIYGFML